MKTPQKTISKPTIMLRFTMIIRNSLLSTLMLLFVNASYAEIINIPDDHETIQAGIDAAEDGDTVLVQPGEYVENIAFGVKSIVVGSLTLTTGDPAYVDSTIINGESNRRSVVSMGIRNERETPIITLTGFTIINGDTDYGGGIYIINAIPTLTHLSIRDNEASRTGGGIYITSLPNDAELIFDNISVDNNSSALSGGGFHSYSSNIKITINNSSFTNNRANDGGGFYINARELNLYDVSVSDNVAGNFGGGGYFDELESLTIENSYFTSNRAATQGGGLAISRCDNCQISRLLISGNVAGTNGGAAYISGSNALISNITVYNNEGREFCGGIVFNAGGEARITQSIFTNNGDVEIGCRPNGIENEIIIGYSLIQAGEEGIELNESGTLDWLDGNIDEDPLFVNPDEGDFHLTEESPCIDAGDPESDPDIDGTIADIGMFPFIQGSLFVQGYILDLANDEPISGAMITSSDGTILYSDTTGYWSFVPFRLELLDLEVSAIGYLDSIMNEVEVNLDDTLSITFRLLHAELQPSIENIVSELNQGELEDFSFEIHNPGNGVLEWSVATQYRGEAGREPWELRQSHEFGEQLDDNRLYGVAFIDSLYYVSGANGGTPTIYILNREGALIDTFVQPGDNNRGMKDLTYDGELIWGVVQNTVYGITLEGEVITSIDAPYHPSTGITWDPDREILWICGTVSNPVGVDRQGNLIEGLEVERNNMRIYGMSYYSEDTDDAPLYLFSKEEDTDLQTLHKYNIDTAEMIFITYLEPEAGGRPYGAFITDQFDEFSWVFMSIADNRAGDRLDIWHLDANTSWAIIDPVAGTINPNADQDITLIINTSELLPIEYPAEMVFTHNGFGLETVVSIDLTVTALNVNNPDESMLPLEYSITDVFPNPFNSTVKLNYTIPKTSNVSFNIFDLNGKIVSEIINEYQQTGRHSVTWDASSKPSGIYFARLRADNFTQTVKLMLMR